MDFSNWFWIVAGDDTKVWSSRSAGFINATNPTFTAWAKSGREPTRIASMTELQQVLADSYPAGTLLTYAADQRWRKEVAGIVVSGIPVATDERSRQMILGARIAADKNPDFTTPWAVGGNIFMLNANQVIALSDAVLQRVHDVFSVFATIAAGLQADPPSITNRAQIDAAFDTLD